MRVTQSSFNDIPNGTRLKIFLEGDQWDEDKGEVIDVVKQGDKLFVWSNYWMFSERDEYGYEFAVCK